MHGYGSLIADARRRRQLSQSDLAELLGWPRADHHTVSRIESERRAVEPEIFDRLIDALGLDRVELVEAMGFKLRLPSRARVPASLLDVLTSLSMDAQRGLAEAFLAIRGGPDAQ